MCTKMKLVKRSDREKKKVTSLLRASLKGELRRVFRERETIKKKEKEEEEKQRRLIKLR